MTWSCRSLFFLLLLGGSATAQAQGPVEAGIHGMATLADYDFAGGGLHAGYRVGARSRFAAAVTAGVAESEFLLRGEVTGQFLLNPGSRSYGLYLGGGLAGVTGTVDDTYLLMLVGIEGRPALGSGWVIEAGIGGGVRLLLGYRWRWGRE